ncbi:MAG: hypothetical protein GF317_16835 [Candidatus Lokiarchaeota archaeon]|nr:hypothetical protein [Candidatus Lokiarchaeota archaeon]MBD3201184.1 hypothetical protein [Candidatus Lokiarchaeota archaeon]
MTTNKPKSLKAALSEFDELRRKIQKDSQRPEYHFLAPVRWMNDPNGPVFANEKYHIFYQFNPFDDTWGHIHWGHAISDDLIHWKHLPIALIPSIEKGEQHCFSGSCVIDDGTPKILYTSIGPNKPPSVGAEQWLAVGDKNLIHWEKYTKNPVMTLDLHSSLDVRDWRDPFIWREGNIWYCVLSGHLIKPKRPLVLLYRSVDLKSWEYINPLLIEDRKKGKNWECPNFFKIRDKYILIVSPHKKVIYNIGNFMNNKFVPSEWKIFDYGNSFYATNILSDPIENRIILWGWIQGGGDIKGWNGCLSLPRVLKLDARNNLIINPLPELKILRNEQKHFQNLIITEKDEDNILFKGTLMELKILIENVSAEKVGFYLYSDRNSNNKYSIGFHKSKNFIWAGKEIAEIDEKVDDHTLKLHIYIDNSVTEVYVNNRYCLTSRIFIKDNKKFSLVPFSEDGEFKIKEIDIWELKPINNKK